MAGTAPGWTRIRRGLTSGTVALVLGALLVGCSSSSHPASSTANAGASTSSPSAQVTTSVPAPSSTAPYAAPGPFVAGQAELHLADGRRVVVWYPADPASAAGRQQAHFDLASTLPASYQAKIPAADRPVYSYAAYPGVAPSTKGPFPLVLFSHGFAGFPEQSVSLTTHLAQWGYVVMAPDHTERDLVAALTMKFGKTDDTKVLSATIDLGLRENADPASPLHGLIDPAHIAVTGHSSGATAAYEEARVEPRVDGFIAYALEKPTGAGATDPPHKPGMIMTGLIDKAIEPAQDRAAYALLHPPKWFVTIARSGHLVFSDICLIGRDKGGIVALAKSLKLGIPDDLLQLGFDGCQAGALLPSKAFGAVNDLSVAFLRHLFGTDPTTRYLRPDVTSSFLPAVVTITSDPPS
jgi:dienelactone hydrolase